MPRPLVPIALIYAGGILVGEWLPGVVPGLLGGSALTMVVAFFPGPGRRWFLVLSLFLLGWTNHSVQQAALSPFDLRHRTSSQPELVSLRGNLLDTPEVRLAEDPSGDTPAAARSQAIVRVVALGRRGDWQPAVGEVLVTVPGTLRDDFYAGRAIEVFGVLQVPPGAAAPGLFDYRRHLAHEGVHFMVKSRDAADWRLLDEVRPPPRPLADRFLSWASRTLAYDLPGRPIPGRQELVDEPFDLLRAMTLGWKTPLTDPVSEPFMRTGTMHVFAISGLHIALMVGILVNLLRAVRLPREFCGLVIIPLIWFYTAATGWQPSALRSTVMMTIVLAGWTLYRPLDLVNSLAGAAWVLLLWKPAQLFQAGFQLSFAVVLSLALLVPPMEAWRKAWLQPDPLAPKAPPALWRRGWDAAIHWVTQSLVTSLAAWLGSVALVAQYFHLLTPISLLANLIVVPLGGLALMASLGALCCGSWLPWLTALFNHSAWFWMKTMIAITEQAAAVPGAWWHVRAFTFLELVLLHGGLVFALTARKLGRAGRWVGAGGLSALLLGWIVGLVWPETTTRMTVLPAGSGAALVWDAPGRQGDLLMDAGSARTAEFVVKPFLQAHGVNALPWVVLSHGDQRHVGGFEVLGRAFRIERVVVPAVRFRSRVYRDVVAGLEARSGQAQPVERGDRCGEWRVVHPAAGDRFPQADDQALVLAGEFHGVRVIALSDLGRLGQRALFEREPDLRADLVLGGMPAQAEPLSDALLQRLQPRVVVLSSGEFPASERPSLALTRRLARSGAEVFSTLEDGAVRVTMGPAGWEVEAMNGRRVAMQIRNPISRNPKEGRNPKTERGPSRAGTASGFGLRVSFGSRISAFGFLVHSALEPGDWAW